MYVDIPIAKKIDRLIRSLALVTCGFDLAIETLSK
jgi:hypothetical protein